MYFRESVSLPARILFIGAVDCGQSGVMAPVSLMLHLLQKMIVFKVRQGAEAKRRQCYGLKGYELLWRTAF